MKPRLLVADDEPVIRRVLTSLLEDAGYDVLAVASGEDAVEQATAFDPDLALLDLRLGGMDGVATMDALCAALEPAPAVIIMTAHGSIASAVDAMKRGAFDYVTKPFDNDELQLVIRRALQTCDLQRRVRALESQLESQFRPSSMIGHSAAMSAVFRMIDRVGPLDTAVLVLGESGTGKELVARAIHHRSRRSAAPFVAVNCGAIPQTLIESTFFGHERGAFTDAKAMRRGAFEQADGGTLFLDEVGELSPAAQAGLLRALQDGEVRRVGSEQPLRVDVRVVAATNRELHQDVETGRFREDLYWRLNVVGIRVPPLRERTEDVPALVDHFVAKHAQRMGATPLPVDAEALALLMTYGWPGNVRELENALEHALAMAAGSTIGVAELPPRIAGTHVSYGSRAGAAHDASAGAYGVGVGGDGGGRGADGGAAGADGGADGGATGADGGAAGAVAHDGRRRAQPTLQDAVARTQRVLEERLIRQALADTGGNRTLAAELLGISRKTLFNKMLQLGIGGGEGAGREGAGGDGAGGDAAGGDGARARAKGAGEAMLDA
jgi:DNA-binding NtrC family response regulator